MRKVLPVLIAALLFITGCSALYKADATKFEMIKQDGPDTIFKYTSVADIYYPINSAEAEKARMEWLEVWLRENGYRTDHYQVLSRVPIVTLKTQSESTSKYSIYYEIRARK